MKKNKKYFTLTMSCIMICTSILAAFPLQASATGNSNIISETELDRSAGIYLEDKASIMLSNASDKNNLKSGFKTRTSNTEKSLIAAYRDRLAQKGETYKDYNTDLEILSQYVGDDNLLYVTAKETTMLTIAENNVDTGYSANHTFVYEQNGDDWDLIEDRQLEPTGLLPLYQANQFVYNGVDSSDADIPVIDDYESDVPEIEASIIKPDVMEGDKISSRSGYNYQAMATYLETYWENYNPAYRSFANDGGDCTNFVSQALKAGGWADKLGWYKSSDNWWYNEVNQTWSWVNVDYLGSFARSSGRCTMLDNVWKLRVGDFLQVKAANATTKTHSMMVSYYSNNTPYFTYHSSNRYRRSMNQVLEDWSGGTYYAYRT